MFYIQLAMVVATNVSNYFKMQAMVEAMGSMAGGSSSAAIGPLAGGIVVGLAINYYYVTVAKTFHAFV